MTFELADILDDVLEVQHQCDRSERQSIVNELLKHRSSKKENTVYLIEGFQLNDTIVLISRDKTSKVKKCVYLNLNSNDKVYFGYTRNADKKR